MSIRNAQLSIDVGHKKKREKTTKQQFKLNKCLNGKRGRELISASTSIPDMTSFSSVKPDFKKCAILQETLNEIRRIKQEESAGSDAAQQNQVSSSKPSILASDILGPLLMEALNGFLFVVNGQGRVEFVSDNTVQYLKYTQEELLGKSVYNIIHVGDHAQFINSLVTIDNPLSGDNAGSKSKRLTFNCRMLVRAQPEDGPEGENRRARDPQYEIMQVSAIVLPHPNEKKADPSSTDQKKISCLVCIARPIDGNI